MNELQKAHEEFKKNIKKWDECEQQLYKIWEKEIKPYLHELAYKPEDKIHAILTLRDVHPNDLKHLRELYNIVYDIHIDELTKFTVIFSGVFLNYNATRKEVVENWPVLRIKDHLSMSIHIQTILSGILWILNVENKYLPETIKYYKEHYLKE